MQVQSSFFALENFSAFSQEREKSCLFLPHELQHSSARPVTLSSVSASAFEELEAQLEAQAAARREQQRDAEIRRRCAEAKAQRDQVSKEPGREEAP